MSRKLISSGSSFESEIGYSRAVVEDNWVFVSGTTGFNYETNTIEDDVALQADQCLKNIALALSKANAKIEDVVRVTYILPVASDFEKCWPVLKKYFGEVKPAITMFSAGLLDDKMKIEIQVTALKS